VAAIAAIASMAVIRPGSSLSHRPWTLGADSRAGVIGFAAVAFALKLILAPSVELLPEEAYYWNYARHLDYGYLDHPPMVGWIIGAARAVLGDEEFAVRIGALLSGVVATCFTYRLTRNLFGEPSALVALVLMQTLPFFFLTGVLMTPDAPLMAAWAAALYFLERALIAERREAWWWAGLAFGIGLLSKYTIALLGLATLVFMLIDARSRQWLKRIEPYGAALLAFVIFSPVIVWNERHEWASFVFQTSRRLADRPQFALHKLIASAVVLLSPTGLAAAVPVLTGQPPQMPGREEPARLARAWRFLQTATLTPLAVFAVFSLRHEVKLDWTGAPWVAIVPALAAGIAMPAPAELSGMRALIRRAWMPTIAALLLVYGAGIYHLTAGIPGLGYGAHAELVPVGWRELGRQIHSLVTQIAQREGERPLVVGMDRYAIASELAFYADRSKGVSDTSSGQLFGQVGLMYERWFPPAAQKGRSLLLVSFDRRELAGKPIGASVERSGPIEERVLARGHITIRPYYYRLAYGYRGAPGPE